MSLTLSLIPTSLRSTLRRVTKGEKSRKVGIKDGRGRGEQTGRLGGSLKTQQRKEAVGRVRRENKNKRGADGVTEDDQKDYL